MDATKTIPLKIDGKEYNVSPTKRITRKVVENNRERTIEVDVPQTIYDAAKSVGVDIPVLCHRDALNVDGTPIPQAGVCRACVVEVYPKSGGPPDRVLAASCCREITPGMEVKTKGKAHPNKNEIDIEQTRRTVIEMLLAEHPRPCTRHRQFGDCELEKYGEQLGILKPVVKQGDQYAVPQGEPKPAFTARASSKGTDFSNPSIAIDHSACIVCERCVRACAAADNHVIGRMAKGYPTSISFDNNKPMGQSSCVNCGECMVACPTGAITYAGGIAAKPPESVTVLTADEMRGMPNLGRFFKAISPSFLKRSEGAVWVRMFKKGEIICRQGEFGSTAFYIDSGNVDILLDVDMGHIRTKKAGGGFFKRMTSVLLGKASDVRSEERPNTTIPIDSSTTDLDTDRLLATVGEGELIGEAACLNFQPRSATVRAASDDVIVVEMLRNVLDMLRKTREFRADMDRKYRERALNNHLRGVPIFQTLPDAFINRLRDRVKLVSFEPKQPIVTQGEPADAFYLIRMGHVKVYESYADDQALVLSYLSRGQYFGEIGLLGGGVRTASCTALDHVECVRIEKTDFDDMMRLFPDIRKQLQEVADARLNENRARATQTRTMSLPQYIEQGLYIAQSLLILDLEKCTRCDECVRACAQAHDGITRLVRDGLRFDKYLVTTSCRSCRDPLCMVGCPVGSIRRKGNMEIIIEDWCIGCGRCAEQCPYGNINMHPIGREYVDEVTGESRHQRKAAVCDLCTDMCLDEDEDPACVYACPHDAAHRVDGQSFFDKYLLSPQAAAEKKA